MVSAIQAMVPAAVACVLATTLLDNMVFVCSTTVVILACGLFAQKMRTSQNPDNANATGAPGNDTPISAKELRDSLENLGVDTSLFGKGSAKSLAELAAELDAGESRLEVGLITKRLTRKVQPIFVALHCEGHVLVEVSQSFPDGRVRKRRMLPAEKRHAEDKDPFHGALRCLHEELGVEMFDANSLPDGLSRREDMDSCFLEEKESASYPGIPCTYWNFTFHFEIRQGSKAASLFRADDICNDNTFETSEMKAEGPMKHCWAWIKKSESRDVVGMPSSVLF
eukprot:TRINITY_DN20112_c2_g2_i1.p1 TRINITY_DN20112_c2_g2~~TRINITY_DN20112_c2_g2_i1.p1  ORF type:complete len:282 (+),score=55.62 TRINITY_DN20112_c2_g2_i1:82-927(+)